MHNFTELGMFYVGPDQKWNNLTMKPETCEKAAEVDIFKDGFSVEGTRLSTGYTTL